MAWNDLMESALRKGKENLGTSTRATGGMLKTSESKLLKDCFHFRTL